MNLPVARNNAELDPAILRSDYVAMSISPLEYKPYSRQEGATTLGYVGVATSPHGLITVAKLAQYDTATSFSMMQAWLIPAAQICLPESREYSDTLLDAVTAQTGDHEPLALFQLEDEGRGDKRISLAARKSLGKIAIEQKAITGLSPSNRELRGIQRRMEKNKLDARKAFGEENYEALVVGGALMLRLFQTPTPRQIQQPSQHTITH